MNKIENVKIPKDEVLRYLGFKKQKIDTGIMSVVDDVIKEAEGLIEPKYILSKYLKSDSKDGVLINGTNIILKGKDIKKHLKNSEEVFLLAATVGSRIEKRILYYEKTELTKAVILDSAATAAIEEVCDRIEDIIKKELIGINDALTFRYSPGYGDLSVDVQKTFLSALNAEKMIGLTATDHNILLPRKSVTAIIGIIDKKLADNKRGCEICANYENCNFRKEGVRCGN